MAGTPEYRFRRRYNLAPNDPRYLAATAAEILIDDWADHFLKHPDAHEGHQNEGLDLEAALALAGDDDDPDDPTKWEEVTP